MKLAIKPREDEIVLVKNMDPGASGMGDGRIPIGGEAAVFRLTVELGAIAGDAAHHRFDVDIGRGVVNDHKLEFGFGQPLAENGPDGLAEVAFVRFIDG